MLKKRIVVATIALGLSLPGLSSASPLSWGPQLDVLARLTRLWNPFGGTSPAVSPRSSHSLRKQGPGIDPTGSPTSPAPGSQTVTPPDPTVTGQ